MPAFHLPLFCFVIFVCEFIHFSSDVLVKFRYQAILGSENRLRVFHFFFLSFERGLKKKKPRVFSPKLLSKNLCLMGCLWVLLLLFLVYICMPSYFNCALEILFTKFFIGKNLKLGMRVAFFQQGFMFLFCQEKRPQPLHSPPLDVCHSLTSCLVIL